MLFYRFCLSLDSQAPPPVPREEHTAAKGARRRPERAASGRQGAGSDNRRGFTAVSADNRPTDGHAEGGSEIGWRARLKKGRSIMRCLFSSLPIRVNTRPKYPANRRPARSGRKISTPSAVYFWPISFVTGGRSANERCYRASIHVGEGGLASSSAVKSLTGKETALTSAVEKYLRAARVTLTFKSSNLNYEVITEQTNAP